MADSVVLLAFAHVTSAVFAVAYAIIVTGECQPFGNFILREGVIGENLHP